MNNLHPQSLTACLISPSSITLHLPPSPWRLFPDPSLRTMSRSLALAEPARADRCSGIFSGQVQHTQQHLRRLPETRPPGAEVSGGQQALPSQLLQVNTAAMAADICVFNSYKWTVLWSPNTFLNMQWKKTTQQLINPSDFSLIWFGNTHGCHGNSKWDLILLFITVLGYCPGWSEIQYLLSSHNSHIILFY